MLVVLPCKNKENLPALDTAVFFPAFISHPPLLTSFPNLRIYFVQAVDLTTFT